MWARTALLVLLPKVHSHELLSGVLPAFLPCLERESQFPLDSSLSPSEVVWCLLSWNTPEMAACEKSQFYNYRSVLGSLCLLAAHGFLELVSGGGIVRWLWWNEMAKGLSRKSRTNHEDYLRSHLSCQPHNWDPRTKWDDKCGNSLKTAWRIMHIQTCFVISTFCMKRSLVGSKLKLDF